MGVTITAGPFARAGSVVEVPLGFTRVYGANSTYRFQVWGDLTVDDLRRVVESLAPRS